MNCNLNLGDWLVVTGAGGGLGHLAGNRTRPTPSPLPPTGPAESVLTTLTVQYGKARGARVIAIDSGSAKRDYCLSLGAAHFLDFKTTPSPAAAVRELTGGGGAHAAVCTAASAGAYAVSAELLRLGGTLACVGIPSGGAGLDLPISAIVIKALRIVGSLVGSLKDTLEAVELTRRGVVVPNVQVRPFRDLPKVYEELEGGEIAGRVVLKVATDE